MLLDLAHSLPTTSKPTIVNFHQASPPSPTKTNRIQQYYRPWKLTRNEEQRIERQIHDAESQIRREVELFNNRKEEHIRRYGRSKKLGSSDDAGTHDTNGNAEEPPAEKHESIKEETKNEALPEKEEDKTGRRGSDLRERRHSKSSDVSGHMLHDESGDVVVGEGEDMVIY